MRPNTMSQIGFFLLAFNIALSNSLNVTTATVKPLQPFSPTISSDPSTSPLSHLQPNRSLNATQGSQNDTDSCNQVCTKTEDIVVPHCLTRIEPDYHEVCQCLMGYHCCPQECPEVKTECKEGFEFPVNVTDCCNCPAIRCDLCPVKETPKCTKGCQVTETIADIMNGCYFQSCKTVCPQMQQISCPECYKPDPFNNASFCNCAQQRCIVDICPAKKELPFKECALRKWSKTRCNCDEQKYDEAHFCDAPNAAAKEHACRDKCFKNVVRVGEGTCECDKPQCVHISEDCTQTFPGWKCPAGSVKKSGTTPCGLDREMCIECDNVKMTNDTCDATCNDVVQAKDVNGCPTEKCKKKACASVTVPKCGAANNLRIARDQCECISLECRVGVVSFDSPTGDFLLMQHHTKGAKNPDGSWAFNRTWADFSTGFGNASLDAGFYWSGLQTVHEWTKTGNWELLVRIRWPDNDATPSLRGKWGWRLYTGLRIGSEAEGFTFNVVGLKESNNMQGTDYLIMSWRSHVQAHNGLKFSTRDKDNDKSSSTNCAKSNGNGWWYNQCYYVNLNKGEWYDGSRWHNTLESVMAIRQI